jgi:hypothetical protein
MVLVVIGGCATGRVSVARSETSKFNPTDKGL